MKSFLLLAFTFFLGAAVIAQQAPVKQMHYTPLSPKITTIDNSTANPGTTKLPAPATKSISDVTKVLIGSSVNVYGSLLSAQTCIDYSPATNLIMNTFRGDQTTPGYLTGNDIVNGFSDDMGNSWQLKKAFGGSTAARCRYPVGVIYNPEGNTDINNAYSVVAGPVTPGSGWSQIFLGSRKFDGGNINEQWFDLTNEELFRNGADVTSNGIFIVGNTYTNDNADCKMNFYRGVFNGTTNSFDYSLQTIDVLPYLVQAGDGTYPALGKFGAAFNSDGSVGYMWTIGCDNRNPHGSCFVPIVFETLDGGESWDILPFQDFGAFPIMENYVIPTGSGFIAPRFGYTNDDYIYDEMDGVVDGKGDLHLFSVVTSASSVHADSAWYGWTVGGQTELANLFEFEFVRDADTWMTWYVDSLLTRPVLASQSYLTSSTGNVAWEHRLQATMNAAEDKVFLVYTDTKPDDWGLEEPFANLYPDVKVWGRDLVTNTYTDAMNMTQLQEGYGECLFMFASAHAIDGEGFTEIPVTIDDLATNGFDADAPVFHYYLKGIQIPASAYYYLADKPIEKTGATVSEVYPNPFGKEANVDVTMAKSGEVSINLSTITGQNVFSNNYGTYAAGKHTLNVKPASNLSSGVYVMTVTVGQDKYTNKVIIK